MSTDLDAVRDGALEVLRDSPTNFHSYVGSTLSPALRSELRKRCEHIRTKHAMPESNGDKEEVVHYTSVANLFRMICSQLRWQARPSTHISSSAPCFRLYDSVHLNDPTEGIHIVDGLPDKYHWLKEFEAHHGYIGSFIRCHGEPPHDNLIFWRTYGRGGEGCSVSFIIPRKKLFRVIYEPTERDEAALGIGPVLETLVDPLLEPLQALSREDEVNVLDSLSRAVWEGLGSIRYLYKDKAYAFERECRTVWVSSDVPDDQRVRFTLDRETDGGQLRHYYSDEVLAFKKIFDSDTKITIGRCVPQKYDVRRSIDKLLRKANCWEKLRCRRSSIEEAYESLQ